MANKEGKTTPFLAEKGASASQMTSAKFLDTICKILGMTGEASDAVSSIHSSQTG